jgi:hypothetical protein
VTTPTGATQLLDVLRKAGEDLDGHGLSWALVGGLAVSARAEPRFTKDIDLAVAVSDDAAAEALVANLRTQGYRLDLSLEQEALGRLATVRLRPPIPAGTGIVVDLLFASSGIEADICQAAERLDVAPGVRVPVARAGHLVAMKLLSRADHRLQDEIDLRTLSGVLTPHDVTLARQAAATIERLGAHRGRPIAIELEQYLATRDAAGL